MQHFSCARRNAPHRAHFKEQNFTLLCDGENETSRSHTNIIKMKRNKLMLIKRLISFKKPFPFNFLAVLALSPRCLLFCSLALSLFLFFLSILDFHFLCVIVPFLWNAISAMAMDWLFSLVGMSRSSEIYSDVIETIVWKKFCRLRMHISFFRSFVQTELHNGF